MTTSLLSRTQRNSYKILIVSAVLAANNNKTLTALAPEVCAARAEFRPFAEPLRAIGGGLFVAVALCAHCVPLDLGE